MFDGLSGKAPISPSARIADIHYDLIATGAKVQAVLKSLCIDADASFLLFAGFVGRMGEADQKEESWGKFYGQSTPIANRSGFIERKMTTKSATLARKTGSPRVAGGRWFKGTLRHHKLHIHSILAVFNGTVDAFNSVPFCAKFCQHLESGSTARRIFAYSWFED